MQELFLTDLLHCDVTRHFVAEIRFLTVSHTSSLPLTFSIFQYFMVFYQNSFRSFYFDITILTILESQLLFVLPPDLHATELTLLKLNLIKASIREYIYPQKNL